MKSAEKQLAEFIGRYTPEIVARAKEVLAAMRRHLPPCIELVYDNYNALVVGFGPTDCASDAVFSIVLYPRWVTLFFLHGATLPDPSKVLKGSGKIVRHVVLDSAADLDKPAIRKLMDRALAACEEPFPAERQLVIKSISARQRARRPIKK